MDNIQLHGGSNNSAWGRLGDACRSLGLAQCVGLRPHTTETLFRQGCACRRPVVRDQQSLSSVSCFTAALKSSKDACCPALPGLKCTCVYKASRWRRQSMVITCTRTARRHWLTSSLIRIFNRRGLLLSIFKCHGDRKAWQISAP
eukprot:7385423-Prymnesium_polylepis.3